MSVSEDEVKAYMEREYTQHVDGYSRLHTDELIEDAWNWLYPADQKGLEAPYVFYKVARQIELSYETARKEL